MNSVHLRSTLGLLLAIAAGLTSISSPPARAAEPATKLHPAHSSKSMSL